MVNIEATVASIRRAVEEAELMAGCEITTVYTGIAGGHIKGFNSQGIVAVKDKEVREADIARVIDAAKAVAIPLDREVIHVLPQEFIIDDQGGIKEPLGMAGVRLEAKVHIVTGAVSSARRTSSSAPTAPASTSPTSCSSRSPRAEAVLGEDEKELGVCLVDIGGGTTDIAIFSGGSIVHTAVIALGGNNLTSDIAIGLRTPAHEAERIKQKYGCALASMVDKDETIEVPSRRRPPAARARAGRSSARSSSRAWRRSSSWCTARSRSAATRTCSPRGVVITGGSTLLAGHARAGRGGDRACRCAAACRAASAAWSTW